MMELKALAIRASSALAGLTLAAAAQAQSVSAELPVIGKPDPDKTGFQPAVTELMRDLVWLDNIMLIVSAGIVAFVLLLMAFVALRYNERAHPTAARFTHYSPVEVAWTVLPIIILVFIGVFSWTALERQQIIPEADLTIKVTGSQWFWTYEYVDHDFGFDSVLLERGELADFGYANDEYLLATDTAVIVPVGKTVVMNVTGADVIHAWTIPSFGVKQDAVPGRLAQLWFNAEVEGVYFGQCSELCGKDHAFMPITVKVVSQTEYDRWLDAAIEEYAGTPRALAVASR